MAPFKHKLSGRYLRLNNITFDNQSDFSNYSDLYYGEYHLQYFRKWLTTTLGMVSSYTLSQSVLFQGEHTTTNNALFLQLDAKAWEILNFSAGLRYEAFRLDSRFFEKPVFRSGISAALTTTTYARASYGQAFRFPSIAESFTATRVGAISVYANPNLKPETGRSYELGIKQLFSFQKIKGYADLAVFQMQYFNMMEYNASFWGEFRPPLFGFGFLPLNIGETRIRGVELATALEGKLPWFNYRLLAGYTYALPQILNPDEAFATDTTGQVQSYPQYQHRPQQQHPEIPLPTFSETGCPAEVQ
ncbi:MAG: TonB-dependent receptor [Owenweeksia sp.]|nr:TonB-dependent receptor [Owenweeksia sp.]